MVTALSDRGGTSPPPVPFWVQACPPQRGGDYPSLKAEPRGGRALHAPFGPGTSLGSEGGRCSLGHSVAALLVFLVRP
eukprot:2284277-Pyramimonas_sp.AAC.1